jgi:hypothetical protein
MAYGPSLSDSFWRVATYVDEILLSFRVTHTNLGSLNRRIFQPLALRALRPRPRWTCPPLR